jgi:DNA-binding MarR family transcriptional regulator
VNHTSFDPVQRPGFLLWQAAHALDLALAVGLQNFGISILQFNCLIHIGNEPGISAAELARRTGLTPQSLQTSLKQLLESGTIERRPHPVHGRVLGIYPTAAAFDLVERAGLAVDAVEDDMTDGMRPAEIEVLHDLLHRALANLNPVALDRSSIRSPEV